MLKGAPEKGLAALLVDQKKQLQRCTSQLRREKIFSREELARESLIASQTIADMAKT